MLIKKESLIQGPHFKIHYEINMPLRILGLRRVTEMYCLILNN